MGWIITIVVLIILFVILLLFHLKIRIQYIFQKNNHHIVIHIYYLKLRILHRKIKLDEQAPDESEFILDLYEKLKDESGRKELKELVEDVISQIKDTANILFILLKSITIHQLIWKTHIGTGDASSTGILSGGVWMIKGTLVGTLNELTHLKSNPQISVIPHFQQRGLYSEVDCIVSIRLGKAIQRALYISRKISMNEVYS
ncbi:DUF2953 domain-containing protein [Ornithinibacillus halotolerans]|uniref:DUF2953 domain-containing protein n=1 Tax=Ornithinibacillus halotolerans TaxID=1274357 RepID=A0A916WAC5_9BACI|nr:DUF2953 domain-containing protein [Ornithinibacillus halotolerans]GGA82224.1 hypothetical protein GCM10008025_26840 [Ornithinibacillus halotolerans]